MLRAIAGADGAALQAVDVFARNDDAGVGARAAGHHLGHAVDDLAVFDQFVGEGFASGKAGGGEFGQIAPQAKVAKAGFGPECGNDAPDACCGFDQVGLDLGLDQVGPAPARMIWLAAVPARETAMASMPSTRKAGMPKASQRRCIKPPRPLRNPCDNPRISAKVRLASARTGGAKVAVRSMPPCATKPSDLAGN